MTRRVPRRAFGDNLRSLWGWRSAAADVTEEMRLHADLRASELEAAGIPAREARARAEREVGAATAIAPRVDAIARGGDRASAVAQRVEEFAQDVRYSWRVLRRSPGFSLLAVLTIALGLGANAAIFGVVNVAFLSPLPIDPDNNLVRVRDVRIMPDGRRLNGDASRRTFEGVLTRPDLFPMAVAAANAGRAMAHEGGAIRVGVTRVGPRFTDVLRLNPVLGRTFTVEEDAMGDGAGVALIGHRFWQEVFGGQRDVLGRSLVIDGRAMTVVGVLPPNFRVPYDSDVWTPSRFGETERSIFILARLAPGVTIERARAELEPIGRELARLYPDVQRGMGITAVSARDYFSGDQSRLVLALMGAVAFLLLIACSNVALLLTTKFAAREKEVAVRAALGCGRGRQIRQFVTEGVMLFAAGGVAGVGAALWMRDALVVLLPEGLATQVGFSGIPIDLRLIAFAALLSAVAGIAFGAVAAMRAAKADLNGVMKGSSRSVASARSRGTLGALAIAEVALALVLLTAAGVMIDAFRRLESRHLGVDPSDVLTLRADLNAARYSTGEARLAFTSTMLERVRAVPGVVSASATSVNPFCCGNWGMRITPEGYPPVPAEQAPAVQHFVVTAGHFETLRQPLVRGRFFTDADREGAERVVIVDRAFADRFWPGADPIGKRVKRGAPEQDFPWLTVIGVVETIVDEGEYTESWYLPYAQNATAPSSNNFHLLVRTNAGAAVAPAVRTIMTEVDPAIALYDIAMLDTLVSENLKQDKLGAILTSSFAAAGLLLAALGLFGVLSFIVNQDLREIAVRVALGASRARVLQLVLRRAMGLTMTGVALGAVVAWWAARAFARLAPAAQLDWSMLAPGAAVLMLAAVAAAIGPAWRALRLDPIEAMRAE